jgi:hypothetical protein
MAVRTAKSIAVLKMFDIPRVRVANGSRGVKYLDLPDSRTYTGPSW